MSSFISWRTFAAAAAVAVVVAAPAGGHGVDHNSPGADRAPYTTSGKGKYRFSGSFEDASSFSNQHGGSDLHLPATRKNVKLLSKFEPVTPWGPIVMGQIADLSIYKNTAYLNSWSESSCTKGGVYTVDISDPTRPSQRGFVAALPGNYHGEGAHVISVATKTFTGDLLAVNNEFCTEAPTAGGGFDLYDVTNPDDPKVLIQGAGDRGKEGVLTGNGPLARSYHSVFLWQAGGKVYAVGVDNEELHDVDIFDVSDPRNPKPVGEYDLLEMFPSIEDGSANGDEIFNHDMVVKTIGGRQVMSVSYWDAGYVLLDVTNPARPTLIRDSSFDGPDPLSGDVTAEGNGHQSEFSQDNQYLLAADEDFAPYRPKTFTITNGQGQAVEYPAAEVGGGTSQASLPDQTLNGSVVYGGYGCPAGAPIPPRSATLPATLPAGEDAIVVLQRGPAGDTNDAYEACFPGEKAAEAKEAGYDAVLLINRHNETAAADEPYCGSGGYPAGVSMVTLCISHTAGHALFEDPAEYTTPYDDETELVARGTKGQKVTATSEFDGWGYGHLYRNSGTKMERIDSFAVPEALDPAYAFDYGDLSIHEFATDPTRNLAYSAYYSAGLRVFKFGESGLSEVGRFIDEGGNNFWGIEQYTSPQGKRVIAASDRDHGLYLFEYTGK